MRKIGGNARAMIVTGGIERAIQYYHAFKDYLKERDIEVLEVVLERKREFFARVRFDLAFGKQEMLLIAKDKKSITDNDLTLALQKAQTLKMPAFILSLGELSKKGKEYLGEWGNLVRFEKLKF